MQQDRCINNLKRNSFLKFNLPTLKISVNTAFPKSANLKIFSNKDKVMSCLSIMKLYQLFPFWNNGKISKVNIKS